MILRAIHGPNSKNFLNATNEPNVIRPIALGRLQTQEIHYKYQVGQPQGLGLNSSMRHLVRLVQCIWADDEKTKFKGGPNEDQCLVNIIEVAV